MFTDTQLRRQFAANADALQRMLDKLTATGRATINGYSADDLRPIIADYRERAAGRLPASWSASADTK